MSLSHSMPGSAVQAWSDSMSFAEFPEPAEKIQSDDHAYCCHHKVGPFKINHDVDRNEYTKALDCAPGPCQTPNSFSFIL